MNNNVSKELKNISNTLVSIEKLLLQLISIQLYNSGASQAEIGKNLQIATGTVNKLVRGMKKNKNT